MIDIITRLAQIKNEDNPNKQRISIERLSMMQLAVDYYNRRVRDLDHLNLYFEAYRYFFQNEEHKKEIGCFEFGKTFMDTLNINRNIIQLYEATDARRRIRRIVSG